MKYSLIMILIFVFQVQVTHAEIADSSEASSSSKKATGRRPSKNIQELAQRFNNFKQCSDRVWPGIKLTERSIAMIDKDGSKWRWENGALTPADDISAVMNERRPFMVNKDKKPPEVILNFKAIENQALMILDAQSGPKTNAPPKKDNKNPKPKTPEKTKECAAADEKFVSNTKDLKSPKGVSPIDAAFKLGVHESFHVCDQTDVWHHSMKPNGNRSADYPARLEAREMRYKTKMALNEALKTNDPSIRQKYLQEASYWHKEYKSKYGVDSANPEPHQNTDLYEGSARYLDLVANSIDCSKDISATEFAEISRRSVLDGISEKPSQSYDGESYELGALAGALLDQKKNTSWKNEAANNGKTALDQLLSSVPPAKGAFSKSQEEKFDGVSTLMPIASELCFIKPDMEYLKNAKNKDYVWISVPSTAPNGKGPYDSSSTIPGSAYVNVSNNTDVGGISVKNQPMVVTSQNPCGGEQSSMVLVPKSSIQEGSVSFDNTNPPGSVNGTVNKTPKNSPLGSVYCTTN